ncbi:hypothetical protein ABKN59_002486 [Abortiporus biennis]
MPSIPQHDLSIVDNALLITSIPTIWTAPHHLSAPISIAASKTLKHLRIVLISPQFDSIEIENDHIVKGISHTGRWDEVQRLLTYVYVQATKVAQEMDKVLMEIDVLLYGSNETLPDFLGNDIQRIYRVSLAPDGDNLNTLPPSLSNSNSSSTVESIWLQPTDYHAPTTSHTPSHPPPILHPTDPSLPPFLPVVALGGTFDHLHAGHKILLSMAAWIASEKLIVGMTDDALLVNKANKQVLQSLSTRISHVRTFLTSFKPSLQYQIVPINDVYGPTAWDPNIQALVVSRETLPGASMIESRRKEKSLPLLKTFVIDVISSTEASLDDEDTEALKKTKMSSTFIREWIKEKLA